MVTQDLSVFRLIVDASGVVQCIMALLLSASIYSWTIILDALEKQRKARKTLSIFQSRFSSGLDNEKLSEFLMSKKDRNSAIEQILRLGLKECFRLKKNLKALGVSMVSEALKQTLEAELVKEQKRLEGKLTLLASIGSVSVYVGLFGTVWGIMHSFQGLAVVKHPTLSTVAPGISEALIATAIGLMVAIPAVFAYNRLMHGVSSLMDSYELLAQEFHVTWTRKLQLEASGF